MKSTFMKFMAVAAVFCGLAWSCVDEQPEAKNEKSLSAEVLVVGETSVSIRVYASNLKNVAVTSTPASEAGAIPTAAQVLLDENATTSTILTGQNTIKVTGLEPEVDYVFYVAAADADGTPYETVVKLEARTVLGPHLYARVASAQMFSATIELTSNNLAEYAYIAANKELAPDLIFAEGVQGELVVDGLTEIVVKGLSAATTYTIYFAAADEEGDLFKEVVPVEFTTLEQTEAIEVHDITKNSATVSVKVPQSVKDAGNVIKWGYSSLVTYLMNASDEPDADAINTCDWYYELYFDDDIDIHIVESEENYVVDPWDGYLTPKFDAPVPGEPGILLMGEYAIGESDYGWGEGYYSALFDYHQWYMDNYGYDPFEDEEDEGGDEGEPGEYDPWDDIDPGFGILPPARKAQAGSYEYLDDAAKYWKGFNAKILINFEKPDLLDGNLDIDIHPIPVGGTIHVTPDENVDRWCAAVIDDDFYNQIVEELLGGDESLLQWFVTSRVSYFYGISMSFEGEYVLDLSDIIDAYPGMDVHFVAVALDGEQGFAQKMYHETFTIPEPTKPAPEIEACAIANPSGEESPYELWFNIKCPTGDAVKAYYACHYEKEFMPVMISSGGIDEMMADPYSNTRNPFSAAEVAAINSPEGLDVRFSSAPNMANCLGVVVYNDEGTPSEAVLVTARTGSETAVKVESPLFASLAGDWTAATKIHIYETDMDWDSEMEIVVADDDFDAVSKVIIGNVGYEETLPESVYETYLEYSKYESREDVDEEYRIFKQYVDEFNARNRGLNRILCQGFNLKYSEEEAYFQPLVYASPYDLFVSDRYNSYNSEAPVIDFGPKWYLEVKEDGSVVAPFSSIRFVPASSWYSSYGSIIPADFVGCHYDANDHVAYMVTEGEFPVEVSADGNTITIHPAKIEGIDFYPTMAITSWSGQSCDAVVADLVLTRGWSGEEAENDEDGEAVEAQMKGRTAVAAGMTERSSRQSYVQKSRTHMIANAPAQHATLNLVAKDFFAQKSKEFKAAQKAKLAK